MTATYQDAELIVQILQWGSQMGIEDAIGKIYAEGFDPEKANANDPEIRKIHNFGETIGTLVKQKVLDRVLVLDLFAIQSSWRRVGPAALRERERLNEPRLCENYEALARQ
jgi:hypothetical protein